MTTHRRQIARAAPFIRNGVLVVNAQHKGRIVVEEE